MDDKEAGRQGLHRGNPWASCGTSVTAGPQDAAQIHALPVDFMRYGRRGRPGGVVQTGKMWIGG